MAEMPRFILTFASASDLHTMEVLAPNATAARTEGERVAKQQGLRLESVKQKEQDEEDN